MGISKNDTVNKTEDAFCSCVKLMSPHLECWAQFWSLHLKKHVVESENAQKRIAKIIKARERISYKERLKMLTLFSLEAKRSGI